MGHVDQFENVERRGKTYKSAEVEWSGRERLPAKNASSDGDRVRYVLSDDGEREDGADGGTSREGDQPEQAREEGREPDCVDWGAGVAIYAV